MKKLLLALSLIVPLLSHAACDIDFNYSLNNDTLAIFGFNNDTSSVAGQYDWYLNYQPIGSGQHVVLYNVQPGYYNIQLQYKEQGTTCYKSKDVKFGDQPCLINQFNYTVNELEVNVDFNNLGYDSLFFTYTWDFGDGSSAIGWYQSHSYQEPGTYLLTLHKTGLDSCSISQYIEVAPRTCTIDFDFEISGSTVSFNSLVSPSDTSSFAWEFGDSSSVMYGKSVSHSYLKPGTYQVLLTRTNSQEECSVVKTITINNTIQKSLLSGFISPHISKIFDKCIVSFYSVNETFQFVESLSLDSGYFRIDLPHDNYLILATPHPESVFFNSVEPTFYGNTTSWQTASILSHNGNQTIDIMLQAAQELNIPDPVWLSGSDLIEGYIYDSNPNARTLANTGFENVMVTLYNELGQKLSITFTDSEGKYTFSNLIAGTYTLQISYPGNNEIITLDVTLDGNGETLEDIAPLNWTKEYIILSSETFDHHRAHISLMPNPVAETLRIEGPASGFIFEILNSAGVSIDKGSTTVSEAMVNMRDIPAGIYLIRIQSDQGSVVKQVIKR